MNQSTRLAAQLAEQGLSLATAESCTGGGLSHLLTSIPGASAFFVGGIIAYQNDIKERFLGVPKQVLQDYGAVSSQTALAMADGCRSRFGTDIAVSITGIAGPGGGSAEKPIGLVYIAVAVNQGTRATEFFFSGQREQIRDAAISAALDLILEALNERRRPY